MHCNGEMNLEDKIRLLTRRTFSFDNEDAGSVLGIPDGRSKLPPGEPILPGHTLIRPTFGMLKSAVKFPHKELEDGAGVYGNLRNLGLRYGGFSDRVLYTKFRRMLPDDDKTVKESDEGYDRHYSNELWHSFETPDNKDLYSVVPISKEKLRLLNSDKEINDFLEWYSQAKELYDHIKFDRNALHFSDLFKKNKLLKKQNTLDEFRQSFYRSKKNKRNKKHHY